MDALNQFGLRQGDLASPCVGLHHRVSQKYYEEAMTAHQTEVAGLLQAWNRGEPAALETLMPLVVDDLRSIAGSYFAREDPSHTLQPTALVNELYMRLLKKRTVQWHSPGHFFGTAAQIMRRLLVDHARQRQAEKRGGGVPKIPLLEDLPIFDRHNPEKVLALDEALSRLESLEPRQIRVVELKCFAGLTTKEIARTLEVGETAVKSDWRFARAWLERELRDPP